jgi:hypothetical protein
MAGNGRPFAQPGAISHSNSQSRLGGDDPPHGAKKGDEGNDFPLGHRRAGCAKSSPRRSPPSCATRACPEKVARLFRSGHAPTL